MAASSRWQRTAHALCVAGILAGGSTALALTPTSSANFSIGRANTNNGGAVQATANFRSEPQIVGHAVVGRSTSAAFAVDHGGPAPRAIPTQDEVYVDPTWFVQADVDNDTTVGGVAGCNPPSGYVLAYGFNAFTDIPAALAAVNSGGRIHLMNGTHEIFGMQAVGLPVTILGEDETVCAGLAGNPGAYIRSGSGIYIDPAYFDVRSADVTFADMQMEGEGPLASPPADVAAAIRLYDGTASNDNLLVSNAHFENFLESGIDVVAPGTTGHAIDNVTMTAIGETAGGVAGARAIRIGGADAAVTNSFLRDSDSGIEVLGGETVGLPPLSGTAYVPTVSIIGNDFLDIDPTTNTTVGAILFANDVLGTVSGNSIDVAATGISVRDNTTSGSVVVTANSLAGPMDLGIDLRSIYGGAAGEVSRVEVTSNTLTAPIAAAGISSMFVGMNAVGNPTETGEVLIENNTITGLQSQMGFTPPVAIRVRGLDGPPSSLGIFDNQLSGASQTNARAGILLEATDSLTVTPFDVEVLDPHIAGNTIESFARGIEMVGAPSDIVTVTVEGTATRAGNTIRNNRQGIYATQNIALSVTATGAIAPQSISDNREGITFNGTPVFGIISDNTIQDNDLWGAYFEQDNFVSLQGNDIRTSDSLGSVGVVVVGAAATVDMGGGAVAGPGNNTFDVANAGAWAVYMDGPGADVSAENNTWSFQGQQYRGSVAVDDLIFDGDADNLAAGGEAAGFGPVDFIPFNGSTTAATTVDAALVRGVDANYGTTRFRALADGVEAASAGGNVAVRPGSHISMHHDADADYIVPNVTVPRAMEIAGLAPGAVVIPGADGPGTPVSTVLEAGSVTLLTIASSDVTVRNLEFQGDSPLIAGSVTVNGVDINARNAVVVDGASAGPLSNITVTDVTADNLMMRGVGMTALFGDVFDNVEVTSSTFTNIQGVVANAALAEAVGLEEVSDSWVAYNSADLIGGGFAVRLADVPSTTVLEQNIVTNFGRGAYKVAGVGGEAFVRLDDNSASSVPFSPTVESIGVLIEDVDTSGSVIAQGNSILGTDYAMVVSSIDPTASVEVRSNTLVSSDSLTGILVRLSAPPTTDTGVLIVANSIDGYAFGVDAAEDGVPFGHAPGASQGAVMYSNFLTNNVVGVHSAATTDTTEVTVGGATLADSNTITGSQWGVLVSGAQGRSTVRFNQGFTGNDVGVRVDGGAAAIIAANRFENTTTNTIQVADAGSEALIEWNTMLGGTNAAGIELTNDALASMGPGVGANSVTNAYFGSVVDSVGYNSLRDYTATGTSFAIVNMSAHDQNAEQNDFGTLACAPPDILGPPFVEDFVVHQVDNPAFGLVLYCPPLTPFADIGDWMEIDQQ